MSPAPGHRSNAGNKRTAFRVMQVCLDLLGLAEPRLPEEETGQIVIRVAQGQMAQGEWLRGR